MNVNGYTLKGVKTFKGHEGEPCYQGSIYLNNKKIGWFSSDYTMGPMDIRFGGGEIEKAFVETAVAYDKVYPMGFPYYNAPFKLNPEYKDLVTKVDAEDFILELLTIAEAEKLYKKCKRMGYTLLVYTYGDNATNSYGFVQTLPREEIERHLCNDKNEEIILYADSLSAFDIRI